MDEIKDSDLNDLKDINDDQERLHFQLSSLWENGKFDPQKVREQFHELKLLQAIMYFFIFSGIIAFLILILINSHPLIIIIDVGVVLVFISYFKYVSYKYRKILRITKKEYKRLIKIKKKSQSLLILQLIFYSFMIIITTLIFIISMIRIDPLILIIAIGISLIYIYLDTDGEDDDTLRFK